jgi:hypothetical protein
LILKKNKNNFIDLKIFLQSLKKYLDVQKTLLNAFTEGLCVQVTHTVSYDEEDAMLKN